MTDLTTLARRRASAAAHVEAIAGFGESADKTEREAFRAALRAWKKAEEAYEKAASMFTTEELDALGVAPDKAA